jgi:hypothetical protein
MRRFAFDASRPRHGIAPGASFASIYRVFLQSGRAVEYDFVNACFGADHGRGPSLSHQTSPPAQPPPAVPPAKVRTWPHAVQLSLFVIAISVIEPLMS